jgi:hypothetical protein
MSTISGSNSLCGPGVIGAPLLTTGVVEKRAAMVVRGVNVVVREEEREEAIGREEALAIPADLVLTVRAAVLQMLRLKTDID